MAVVRRFDPSDRSAVLALAVRLVADVPDWRDRRKVSAAVEKSISELVDAEPRSDAATFVAEENGSVVGFSTVTIGMHFSGERQASIDDLVVDQDSEGSGIGQRLVTAAEAWANDHDVALLVVETSVRNERALRLYRRLGFVDEDLTLSKNLRS